MSNLSVHSAKCARGATESYEHRAERRGDSPGSPGGCPVPDASIRRRCGWHKSPHDRDILHAAEIARGRRRWNGCRIAQGRLEAGPHKVGRLQWGEDEGSSRRDGVANGHCTRLRRPWKGVYLFQGLNARAVQVRWSARTRVDVGGQHCTSSNKRVTRKHQQQ